MKVSPARAVLMKECIVPRGQAIRKMTKEAFPASGGEGSEFSCVFLFALMILMDGLVHSHVRVVVSAFLDVRKETHVCVACLVFVRCGFGGEKYRCIISYI